VAYTQKDNRTKLPTNIAVTYFNKLTKHRTNGLSD